MSGISRPEKELGVINAATIKNCTEIYLGGRGLHTLAGFEPFSNLEVLWLNNNQLTSVSHLDHCPRLQKLYLQGNQIQSLDDCVLTYRFCRVLSLENNMLYDLEALIRKLKRLDFLENLVVRGNPLAEELNYRPSMIRGLPKLQVLDDLPISEEERAQANRADRHKPKGKKQEKRSDAQEQSNQVITLYDHLKQRHEKRQQRRSRRSERKVATDNGAASSPSSLPTRLEQVTRQTAVQWMWQSMLRDELTREFNANAGDQGLLGVDAAVEVLRTIQAEVEVSIPELEAFARQHRGSAQGLNGTQFVESALALQWDPVEEKELIARSQALYSEAEKLRALGDPRCLDVAARATRIDPRVHPSRLNAADPQQEQQQQQQQQQQQPVTPATTSKSTGGVSERNARRAPATLKVFSYEDALKPLPLETALKINHRRPWLTAHIGRRSVQPKTVDI